MEKILSQKGNSRRRLHSSCSPWPLLQSENIRGRHVCCGWFCSSHLEIPEDESCRCKYQIGRCSWCDTPTLLLFAVWLPAPSVPLSRPALCPVRQLFIHFSHSVHLQSFLVSLLLPFILSAGFTIRTITLVSLTMCAFILLPTYFIWVDVWALNPWWYYRLARVCVCLNGSWLVSSFLHFPVDRHFVALLQFFCHFIESRSCD